jgi:Fic family protein
MKGLITASGRYRQTNVGILRGKKVGHVAPQAKMVPALMTHLFSFIKKNKDVSFLIKACVFHYELEFIHPFEDGNGRMGRLWQQALLMKHSKIFEYVAVESLVHQKQEDYYRVLEACDKKGNSTQFIEFCLELTLEALMLLRTEYRPSKATTQDRLLIAFDKLGTHFSRKDYLSLHKDISTATASRDLANGVKEGLLKRTGDKSLAVYRKLVK